MQKVNFVTTNKGKFISAKRNLTKFGIEVKHYRLEMPESRGEIGQITKEKAQYAFGEIKKPVLVNDAGFFVPVLGGFPRMFTNFVLETIGIEGILKLVEGEKRDCYFGEYLGYYDESLDQPKLFERKVKGSITKKPRGKYRDWHWSEISTIFLPENKEKTLAEMTKEEYENFSEELRQDSYWKDFAEWFGS